MVQELREIKGSQVMEGLVGDGEKFDFAGGWGASGGL